MAGTIRDLIELLLTEIAIQGTDGATLAQIWEWVHSFYRAEISNALGFHLDYALKEDLWQWLTLNPEVSVGRNRQYNHLSLSQVEAAETQEPDLRIFVSEDRTWRALTGHERDDTRVPASEFELLSIIASCRSEGILQTELVRRSGQDSRSVPKRTDALKAKGYIDKRPVQAKSAKTSLCVFSRFALSASVTSVPVAAAGNQDSPLVIDIDAFAQSIFRVLKQHQIISRNDLKEELGLKDHWRWRNLSKTIRKFEAIGCLRRVKARSQFHDTMKAFHPCVLLIREPTDADMKLFKSDYKTLFSSMDRDSIDHDAEDLEEPSELQTLEHVAIRWSPDISVPNLMVDIIDRGGTAGRSNAQIIKEGFGRVFRRPSENTLSRLTEGWQLSQPPHLRHNAIVRDVAQSGTVTHFVHYAYPHFKKLVDGGQADWEAVTFRPRDARSSKITMPAPDAPADTDEDGLVPFKAPRGKVAEMDLYCLIASKGITSYTVTKSDPAAVVDDEGQIGVSFEREHGRPVEVDVIREPREVSMIVEEAPQEEAEEENNASTLPHVIPSERLGKLSKSERIEAELAKGIKPAKEVFAAFGLDESWTHVAVRLMERPGPGVYVTAKGKARPAGQKQGRPKESRIAVFKSPSLVEFLKSIAPPLEDAVQLNTSTGTAPTDTAQATDEAPASTALVEEGEEGPSTGFASDQHGETGNKPAADNKHGPAPADATDVSGQAVAPVSDRPLIPMEVDQSQTPQHARETPLAETIAEPIPSSTVRSGTPTETPFIDEPDKLTKSATPSLEPKNLFPKSRRSDKDGSVSRLRRNILMSIIERAGGAFPSGRELWHAFATIWIRQHNSKEKPDSRTIKNAVKYLVDAGKLRQLTFSGRTPKGEMVTRSIVMKPELDPTDPVVTEMQNKMLETGYYIPQNVELDPNIAKLVSGGGTIPAGVLPKPAPVDPSVTVQLRNKPAFVVALEKRREESLQKRLLKPVRLMGLQRTGRNGITSFSRPHNRKRHVEASLSGQRASEDEQEAAEHDVSLTPMEIEVPRRRLLKHRLAQPLDRALEEVKRQKRQSSNLNESPYRQFVGEIDYVSQWERINQMAHPPENPPSNDSYDTAGNLSYVHHTIDEPFQGVPIDGMIHFDVDGVQRRRSRPVSTFKQLRRPKRTTINKIAPAREAEGDELPSDYREVQEHPEKNAQAALDDLSHEPSSISSPQVADVTKPQAARRRRSGLKELGARQVERLRYAIVVVRTIAGGVQGKMVDWNLVARAFPGEDPDLIRHNGRLLLNRDRRQLAQIQEDLREILLEEYRKPNCSLPSIDFGNLASYDWDALTTWAATQYYAPSTREVPNLPGTRAQFDRLHEYRVIPPNDQFELVYTPNPAITIAKKENMYASRPFVCKPERRGRQAVRRKRDDMDVAKSWILSNIIAKDQTYDSVDAKRKLSLLPGDVFNDGLKELVRDRVIMHENRGRIIPGRNFGLTDSFINTFGRKRAVDVDMLKQAVETKATLDADFKRDGFSHFRYVAADGEAMAIMALAAEGRVHVHPSNPPSDPAGLTEGSYETRALDKVKFKFELVVAPDSERYEYGNPVEDRIKNHPVPSLEQPEGTTDAKTVLSTKPPLWVDINGNVNRDIWQSVVSSVVGILAVRPCLRAQGICEQLQGYLSVWDIERILAWLDRVGLASRVDRGEDSVWRVKEYWWLVLSG